MLSRVFGLVRDQMFAALIGAGFLADCYVIAFRLPNLFRDLFAEGALSNAFVPTLTKAIRQDSAEAGKLMVSKLLGLALLVVTTVVILGIAFAPTLVDLIAPGFSDVDGKAQLTTLLTSIMFPFLLFISLASIMMGIHHAHQSFSIPATAPLVFNICAISAGVMIYKAHIVDEWSVIVWSMGTVAGGIGQLGVQLPSLIRAGRVPWPSFGHILQNPRVREMLTLMGPAVIALSGAQVNILVNTILASLLQEGAPSWLNYGFRLIQLPIGIFGVAIGVVALAQTAQSVSINDDEGFLRNVDHAMKLNWILTIPCAVGLWVMADPIIALLFERGAFTAFDTKMTAQAIRFFALGLPFYAGVKVKGPVFFSKGLANIPMVASLCGIAINIVFNILMYKKLGHWGLALGVSIGMLVNFVLLSLYFVRQFRPPDFKDAGLFFFKVIVISVLMGCITWLYSRNLFKELDPSEWYKLMHVTSTIGVAVVSYIVLVKALGVWKVLAKLFDRAS